MGPDCEGKSSAAAVPMRRFGADEEGTVERLERTMVYTTAPTTTKMLSV